MISKKLLSTIKSLDKRKRRMCEGLFIAEGAKLVGELLPSFPLRRVVAVEEWIGNNRDALMRDTVCETVTNEELRRVSLQRHPQDVIALFALPQWRASVAETAKEELTLALDNVQDPGNLGTIVRLANWFGIGHVFCSTDSADIFSPKAVQATMGALGRVRVYYVDLARELGGFSGNIYGTFPNGQSIHEAELSQSGVILLGNEGNGIRPELARLTTSRLSVPPHPIAGRNTVESLNVAVAAAIVCHEFRRRK